MSSIMTQADRKPAGRAPSVAVMILNYNGLDESVKCIESLQITQYPNYQLVLVDNGSTDGSVEYVERRFPWIRTVALDRNYGFTKAYNTAVKQTDSAYLLLLNNDIIASQPEWLAQMVRVAESDPNVGAVGAKLLNAVNPSLIDDVGGKVYRWIGGTLIGRRETDRGQYDNPPIEPFYVSGGALLVRRNAFEQVDGFDPEIFAYSEDLDLCWRLRLVGYRIAYCPGATLLHGGSTTWRKFGSAKLMMSQRNFLYTCLKNYSTSSLLKEVPPLLFLNVAGAAALSITLRKREPFTTVLRSLLGILSRVPRLLLARLAVQSNRIITEPQILKAMGCQRIMSYDQVITRLSF